MNTIASSRAPAVAAPRERYSAVAIAFHWTIAAALAVQVFLGWRMEDLTGQGRSAVLQVHKSIGIMVLLLTAARLAWRLMNPPPPHGSSLTPLERRLSHWVHLGFYAVLLILPLSGWAMVSMRLAGGMSLFGLVPWPQFPLVSALPGDAQEILSDLFGSVHAWLAWMTLALLALHVLGALKHHFISRDPTLARMAPGVKPGRALEPRLVGIVGAVVAIAAAVYLPKPAQAPARPKPAQLAQADIYLDIVGPALERRCGSCHNEDQPRGGLSLATYDALLRGGRHGAVVVRGQPSRSELYRRITLTPDNAKYMPKDGRTPLTAAQVKAIAVWIEAGAPGEGLVGSLKLRDEQKLALQKALGGSAPAQAAGTKPGAAPLPVVPAVDPMVSRQLESNGFVVRPVAKGSQLVVVDFTARRPLTDADFALLGRIAVQTRVLNLGNGQVSDAQLKTLAPFVNLAQLRLDDDPVTDAGLANLVALKSLTYLNLVGSKVTDAGLGQLQPLTALQRLYLWGTAVTPAGVDRFKAAHPGAFVYAGLKPSDVSKEPKMAPVN